MSSCHGNAEFTQTMDHSLTRERSPKRAEVTLPAAVSGLGPINIQAQGCRDTLQNLQFPPETNIFSETPQSVFLCQKRLTSYFVGEQTPVILVQHETIVQVVCRHVCGFLPVLPLLLPEHPPDSVRLGRREKSCVVLLGDGPGRTLSGLFCVYDQNRDIYKRKRYL